MRYLNKWLICERIILYNRLYLPAFCGNKIKVRYKRKINATKFRY